MDSSNENDDSVFPQTQLPGPFVVLQGIPGDGFANTLLQHDGAGDDNVYSSCNPSPVESKAYSKWSC